ncbi:cobalamin biosynthesis protein [Pseudomonas sp.]|uniref:cobalamin biosynthesis protein n=1 Tax=Pseudomonas sp. TaxID=306 RepID=UPI003CC63B63
MPTLYAGLGCQRNCPITELITLLDTTLTHHNLTCADLAGLATIDLKANEPALLELARTLNLPLITFSAAQLAPFEPQLSHKSALAFTHTGCHGVAESAALALAGPGSQLLVPRQKNTQATLALAQQGPIPG